MSHPVVMPTKRQIFPNIWAGERNSTKHNSTRGDYVALGELDQRQKSRQKIARVGRGQRGDLPRDLGLGFGTGLEKRKKRFNKKCAYQNRRSIDCCK